MKIKEIIVVEGRDDTNRVKEALECDTFETNGSAITREKLERLKKLNESRGIIVLT
ncbi:MAG: ribonuclease M5, partial [Gemella sp.]|nr:ribonuclease M5 [Gemella sp.]